jgi:putative ABC transport system substrate-binding protein
MDRRTFVGALALGALAGPGVARAQPARTVRRIGILGTSFHAASDLAGPQPKSPRIGALLRGLRELGHVYGEHFVTEPRSSEGKPERFPGLAAELVRLQVDVIVAPGPALLALRDATSTIPIVMTGAADPVGDGLAHSLGRPGRNFTGLSIQMIETTGKRLELLKELVPGAAPVAVLWDPRGAPARWQAAESAARARGWKLVSLEIREAAEIEVAFRAATAARAGALLVLPGSLLDHHSKEIADLAVKHRLPAMYGLRYYVDAGGLMSYGADIIDVFRRSAAFIDKIWKGARPGDLPIEQPTKFELVINLKAARAIGLTIPRAFQARADTVIQ